MRFSRLYATLVATSSVVACGKSETPAPAVTPAPTTATPPATATTTPTPDTPAPADPKPVDAPVPEVPKTPAYIVWTTGTDGIVSTWIAPGVGGYEVVATRPQLAVFADDTLWGLERPISAYQQVNCDDFENETDEAPAKPSGKPQSVEHLAIRGLSGASAGKLQALTPQLPDYFQKDADAKGIYTIVGELWGRQLSVVGSAGATVLVIDCASAFSCGAHGDTSCQYIPYVIGTPTTPINLAAATKALSASTASMIKDWKAGSDGEELGEPSVQAVSMRFAAGAPAAEYLYVADVSYVASNGDWSSYTQSRTHTGPVVPELGLPEVPAEVRAWLAGQTVSASYGWSTVPLEADPTLLLAFKDTTTVPSPSAPAVAVDPNAAPSDPEAMVKRGRELTRDNKFDDAIGHFSLAIEMDPAVARAWSGRGYARLRASDFAGAAADFAHALTLDESAKFQAAVYFNIGELAEKQGDPAAALTAYRKSNELTPSTGATKRITALSSK